MPTRSAARPEAQRDLVFSPPARSARVGAFPCDANGRTMAAIRAFNPYGACLAAALACLASLPASPADRQHTLNIYAWAEYFPRALVAQFEAASGLHVHYSVLDSPAAAETILSVGHSDYDLVTMNAAPELAREIPRGFWKPLDRARVPNARNADAAILKLLARVDPNNEHAVPWMWGTTGLIYDRDKVQALMPQAPLASLAMILERGNAARFAGCGIGLIDSWGDILPLVARYLGQPTLSAEPAPLAAVVAKLKEIKPYIRRVSTAGYYQQLAQGELCLAIGYSGDALIARRMVSESQGHLHIDYSFLREMVPFYIDSMVIPADAPNPDAAHAFIDFMMRPDISAQVTRFIGFATANAAAMPLLEPAVRDNTIIYPPAEVRARFQLQQLYTSDEVRTFNRVWLEFKTGS
jgi:putrescine transport system substrate-binding protein